jgi:glyoxylase-like metal-dependent hydrolase (beta-lactamase superfamily II)
MIASTFVSCRETGTQFAGFDGREVIPTPGHTGS